MVDPLYVSSRIRRDRPIKIYTDRHRKRIQVDSAMPVYSSALPSVHLYIRLFVRKPTKLLVFELFPPNLVHRWTLYTLLAQLHLRFVVCVLLYF